MPNKKEVLDCYQAILAHYKAVKMECSRMSHKHEPESLDCKKLKSLMSVNDGLIDACELEINKLKSLP
jgi:hypothetical protein